MPTAVHDGHPAAAEVAAALGGETAVAETRVVSRHAAHNRRPLLLAAAAAVAVIAALIVAFSGGSNHPAKVTPVPHATTATQQARNVEAWLKKYSR